MVPSRPLILGVGDVALGLTLATGAPSRTSSRAYAQIKQVATVHHWGLGLLAVGVLLLLAVALLRSLPPQVGHLVLRACALAGAVWSAYWAVVLLQTANADARVAYSGAVLYGCFVVVPHLFLTFGREG
jgi:hypothetical protein